MTSSNICFGASSGNVTPARLAFYRIHNTNAQRNPATSVGNVLFLSRISLNIKLSASSSYASPVAGISLRILRTIVQKKRCSLCGKNVILQQEFQRHQLGCKSEDARPAQSFTSRYGTQLFHETVRALWEAPNSQGGNPATRSPVRI